MKPQHQTIFGPNGNCWAACVATILDLDLATLPNFCAEPSDGWLERFNEWLAPRGYFGLMLKANMLMGWRSPTVTIAGGTAARGYQHACVYDANGLAFDPHPDGTGLIEVLDYTFFVAIEPATFALKWAADSDGGKG